jgi:hypothetical protein
MGALRQPSLGQRLFLYATALVIGLGLVLPTESFRALVLPWCAYAAIFALIGAARHGLLRGFALPSAALGLVAAFNSRDALPVCFAVWLVAVLGSVAFAALRFAFGWLKRRRREPSRQARGKPALVSVAVRGQAPEINAADILARLGFEGMER